MKEKINIGIIGGSGYTGLELVKILKKHKYSNISFLTSRTYKNKKYELKQYKYMIIFTFMIAG